MKRLVPLVALAGVFALVWFLQDLSGSRGVRPERHNLVLISLDGLRAAHLSMSGYPRQTTSGLDRLAKTAIRFDNAISQSPDVLESHASIFTGNVPTVHGASKVRNQPVRDAITTMAEELQFHDYDTAAFVSAFSRVRAITLLSVISRSSPAGSRPVPRRAEETSSISRSFSS